MAIELVVVNFDGTLTEPQKDGGLFITGYQRDLAERMAISETELSHRWNKVRAQVEAEPGKHGWVYGRKIVAPAYADPFIMARTIATELLCSRINGSELDAVLEGLYQQNHQKSQTIFRDDCFRFLIEIQNRYGTCILTNSGKGDTQTKLGSLHHTLRALPIFAHTERHRLDDGWLDVPDSIQPDGWARPVYLRRRLYWNTLAEIMRRANAEPEQTVVVGDIYELDLALPLYKGMCGILVSGQGMPVAEHTAVREAGGYVAETLIEVLNHINKK